MSATTIKKPIDEKEQARLQEKYPHSKVIELAEPLNGETQLRFRKPKPSDLMGLKMLDIVNLDCEAMLKLSSRLLVSDSLSEHDLFSLDPSDLIPLCTEVVSFFTKTKS